MPCSKLHRLRDALFRNGSIFQKCVRLLAYSDDIVIIGRIQRNVTATFSAIERESIKMSLAVNEGKTKYRLSTSRDVRHIDSRITAVYYALDTVKKFVSLGSAVAAKNIISLEIKRRMDHPCQQLLTGQLSNRVNE